MNFLFDDFIKGYTLLYSWIFYFIGEEGGGGKIVIFDDSVWL